MCLSPHEMTSARIEYDIEKAKAYADQAHADSRYWDERAWLQRAENFLKILKERAEDGTYHDDTGRY